jgi:hypothetical protein
MLSTGHQPHQVQCLAVSVEQATGFGSGLPDMGLPWQCAVCLVGCSNLLCVGAAEAGGGRIARAGGCSMLMPQFQWTPLLCR